MEEPQKGGEAKQKPLDDQIHVAFTELEHDMLNLAALIEQKEIDPAMRKILDEALRGIALAEDALDGR